MNTENIKVIAMDLDGTLLRPDKKIAESTKKYLKRLHIEGYSIIAVTGRILKNSLFVQEGDLLFDYVICAGGTIIYDVRNKKILWEVTLDPTVYKKIADLYKSSATKISFCDTEYYHNYGYSIRKGLVDTEIADLDDFYRKTKSIYKMEIFFDNEDLHQKCLDTFSIHFPFLSYISMQDSFGVSQWIEVYPKNVNKVTALKKLLSYLNYTIENVVAFGDGRNDIEFLKESKIGVAMGNALDIVKEVADDVTLSYEEKGVEYWLKQHL